MIIYSYVILSVCISYPDVVAIIETINIWNYIVLRVYES
jgi:hypothetical protein